VTIRESAPEKHQDRRSQDGSDDWHAIEVGLAKHVPVQDTVDQKDGDTPYNNRPYDPKGCTPSRYQFTNNANQRCNDQPDEHISEKAGTNAGRNRKVEVCSSSPKTRKSIAEKPLTSSIAHLS
jgi:hypothetical protein